MFIRDTAKAVNPTTVPVNFGGRIVQMLPYQSVVMATAFDESMDARCKACVPEDSPVSWTHIHAAILFFLLMDDPVIGWNVPFSKTELLAYRGPELYAAGTELGRCLWALAAQEIIPVDVGMAILTAHIQGKQPDSAAARGEG